MLLLKKYARTIENVTIFADDQDSDQFWYLSGDIHLATQNGDPVFSLIKYAGDAEKQGGGYLTLQTDTSLTATKRASLLDQFLLTLPPARQPKNPRLDPVTFDSGQVNIFAVGLQKGEQVFAADSPSLAGKNTAVFNAALTQQQEQILEGAFKSDAEPVSVVYTLAYSGMSPALDVEITAKYERILDSFEAAFSLYAPIPTDPPSTFKLGFDAVFEKLIENKELVIKVKEYVQGDDIQKQRDWAIDFVKQELLTSLFSAELTVPKPGGNEVIDFTKWLLAFLKGTLPMGSLELKYVGLRENKQLTLNYQVSQVMSQAFCPQSQIGGLLKGLPKTPPYFVAVDMQDPFFAKVDYLAQGPDNFTDTGLQSVLFNLTYDGRHYGMEQPIDKPDECWKKTFNLSPGVETFDTISTFIFKPESESGWQGDKVQYDIAKKTHDRNTFLLPESHFNFLDIEFTLENDFFWNEISQVQVDIHYQNQQQPETKQKTKTLVFTPKGETSQRWKLRLEKPSSTEYTYQLTYIMQDGTRKQQPPLSTDLTTNIVSDLVKYKLQETFLFDTTAANQVLVEVKAGKTFKTNFSLNAETPFKTITIPQDSAEQQTFSFTCGFVPPYNGQTVYEYPDAEYPSMVGLPYQAKGKQQ